MKYILARDFYKFFPEIELRFFSRASMASVGDAVLAGLAEDSALAPQKFGAEEPYRIPFPSLEANELWRTEAQEFHGAPGASRHRPFSIIFSAYLGIGPNCPFHRLGWTADSKVLDLSSAPARIEALFCRLAAAFQSYYAYATHNAEFERQNVLRDYYDPRLKMTLQRQAFGKTPEKAIPGVYWLNYFGPEYTRFIGADRLRALDPPAEPLGDGMLLKLAPSPLDMLGPSALERTDSIRHQLGEDLFFDIRHPDRKTRAPFVPRVPRAPDPPAFVMPSIPDVDSFIATAAERADRWRQRHALPIPSKATIDNARKTLRLLEQELEPGLPDIHPEEVLADATAVLGQLILGRLGGRWEVTSEGEPVVITDRRERVYLMRRIVKRSIDADAKLFWWFERLVKGTLPDPLKPELVE